MSTIKLPASPATVGYVVLYALALGADVAAAAAETAAERLREARLRVREAIARRGGR